MRKLEPHATAVRVLLLALVSTTCTIARPTVAEESTSATESEARTDVALAEIMAAANRFERNATLYRYVADADRQRIETLLAALSAKPGAPRRDDVARVLYVRFASLEPGTAVAHALHNYPKPQVLEAVFRAWAHDDLEAAVARASTLPTVMKRDAARAILDLDLTASERTSIAERLGMRPDLVEIEQVSPPRAQESYDQALARVAAIGDGRARFREVGSLAAAWAAENAPGALAAILEWRGDEGLKDLWLDRVMDAWSDADPRAAVDWLLTRDPDHIAKLVGPAFAALAKTDLAEAESLVAALPKGVARRDAQLSVLAAILDQGDLDHALAAFGELDLKDRQTFAPGIGRRLAREDPDRAVAWVMDLDEAVRASSLRWVFASIHGADPELAKRLVEDVDDASLRIEAAQGLFTRGTAEPANALRWARSLGSDAQTAPLLARIFSIWSGKDLPAAMDAVMGYAPGPVRDQALQSMIERRLIAFDPETAERLLDAIDSPAAKSEAAARVRAYRANEGGS